MSKKRRPRAGQSGKPGTVGRGKSVRGKRPPDPAAKTAKRRTWTILAIILGVVVVAGGVGLALWSQRQAAGSEEGAEDVRDTVRIETTRGTIVMELYPKLTPNTVTNFENLAKSGFYDGLVWHRVEDWVVQTGDPTGTGMGGSEKTIKLETAEELANVRGAVGMARSSDPDSASSQFYILKSDARSLDGNYAVFGMVVEGMDVVDKLTTSDKMTKVTLVSAAGE